MQAVLRTVQISRQLRTTSWTIKGYSAKGLMPVTSLMIPQEPNVRVRPRSTFCDVRPFTYTSGRDIKEYSIQQLVRSVRKSCSAVINANERHARYWLCDFSNLGTGSCGFVVAVNGCRMNFFLAHSIVKYSLFVKQYNWIKNAFVWSKFT